ncbi:hypothetical protein BD779DRAFT_1507991 [Infundibulicybe gibba]|nr:hypothetical protein BD779DRAFT_1584595 [Infundibulicybe gibba]KAF8883835.1 hypothetical protein BD779DRAFT_1538700 [Infundibulicybe gibba]KAF8892969.1 hypothetical protein BD779DRAFT_1507991 [Infundibulicybe gibba]
MRFERQDDPVQSCRCNGWVLSQSASHPGPSSRLGNGWVWHRLGPLPGVTPWHAGHCQHSQIAYFLLRACPPLTLTTHQAQ